MVSCTNQVTNSLSTFITQESEQCASTTQSGETTPNGKQTSVDGLSIVRQNLSCQGISETVQGTILQSWRSGTQKQYRVYLSKWELYTSKWEIDPFHPAVSQVLEFLQDLYDMGLSYSALNTVILDSDATIGTHPLVQRFMKGVFQTRPAVPRYTSTWDTSVVLSYLKRFHPATDLTLQQLTHKLVMLCALVTGQRCQSLHLMNLETMHMEKNSYTFHIQQLVKQSAPGKVQPVLAIPRFPSDASLCVATVLDEYIRRTTSLRGSEKQLFISFIRPHKKVSKESISPWIKNVMQAAGIDINF